MVAGGGHPRPVPRRPHVVGEERGPGLDRRVAHVGVAQVAVHQVEQGIERVDRIHDVPGVGGGRAEPEADRGGNGLVAEAGEPEPARTAPRPGAERAWHRIRAVVPHLVDERGVRREVGQARVVGVHRLTGHGLGIDTFLGRHVQAEATVGPAGPKPRPGHRSRCRPGDRDLGGGVRTELDVHLLGRRCACHVRPPDQGWRAPWPGQGGGAQQQGCRGRGQPARLEDLPAGHFRYVAHCKTSQGAHLKTEPRGPRDLIVPPAPPCGVTPGERARSQQ